MRHLFVLLGLLLLAGGSACSAVRGRTPTPLAIETVIPTAAPIVTEPAASPTAAASATQAATAAPTVSVPTATVALLPTAASAQAPTPAPAPSRISFAPGGTSATLQASLGPNGIRRYVLRVLAGQTMSVDVVSPQTNMLLSINGADGAVLKSMGAGQASWTGLVPKTQDYVLTVSTSTGNPANYTLQVTIPPLATAPVTQDIPRRITFAPGATGATIQGTTATPGADRFVVRALAGQTMTVNVASASGNVIVIIYGADGNVLISDHAGATHWTGQIPATQDYMIDTRSVGNAQVPFTLSVTAK